MIKSVTVKNHLNKSIVLDMFDPYKSGFAIKNIDGLGPPEATINTSDLATMDGSIFNSSRVGTRNIVFDLQFIDDPTVGRSIEDCRLASYTYFPIKRPVTITIETDRRSVETTGWVESNGPSIFAQDCGCQISILCPDPYFYKAGFGAYDQIVFTSVIPKFEFPFENNSDTEKLLEFGEVRRQTVSVYNYEGDAEPGMIVSLHVLSGTASGFTIYNLDAQQKMSFNDAKIAAIVGSGLSAGDTLRINTNHRQKSVTLVRNGEEFNVLNSIILPFDWFHFIKGENNFYYTLDTGYDNSEVIIDSRVVYEGV